MTDGMMLKVKREPITRDRIIEAALTILDREGTRALSMRRIGRELGVEAMSLYGYVNGKDEILEGVSERLVGEIDIAGSGDWRDVAVAFVQGVRRVALEHPSAFQLVAARPVTAERFPATIGSVIAAFEAAGLSPADAAAAYRVLISFVRGYALAEVARGTAQDRGRRRSKGVEHAALSPPAPDRDPFEFGTEVIVAGLAQLISSRVPT